MQHHKTFLLQTLRLAENRLGFCAPNPSVGAVVVKNNEIISTGFHIGAGHPHAEVVALDKIGDRAKDAVLYVSLEPCCHYGKTPPCIDRIKQAGISAVYFGCLDPNPLVSGKGAAFLNHAGIPCEPIALPEIDLFYMPYIYWTKNKKPFVTAKLALSQDYKIADEHITGKECDLLTHHHRKQSDALLTTINTILQDNPNMNARLDNKIISKPIYILDSRARLPLHATIWRTAKSITIFHAENAAPSAITQLTKQGARCIAVSHHQDGLDLNMILNHIGQDGFHTVWIEAGAQCFYAFLKQNLLHRVFIYVSPTLLGEKTHSTKVDLALLNKQAKQCEKNQCGRDLVYCFDLHTVAV